MDTAQWIYIGQLALAAVLGGIIGFEREHEHKEAGIRTHALVAMGSTLFSAISLYAVSGASVDPSRIMSQVVVGVGFLSAGIIIFRNERVQGLTTAAGLWVCAAIGMAVAVGWYQVAVLTALIVTIVLHVMRHIFSEERIEGRAAAANRGKER